MFAFSTASPNPFLLQHNPRFQSHGQFQCSLSGHSAYLALWKITTGENYSMQTMHASFRVLLKNTTEHSILNPRPIQSATDVCLLLLMKVACFLLVWWPEAIAISQKTQNHCSQELKLNERLTNTHMCTQTHTHTPVGSKKSYVENIVLIISYEAWDWGCSIEHCWACAKPWRESSMLYLLQYLLSYFYIIQCSTHMWTYNQPQAVGPDPITESEESKPGDHTDFPRKKLKDPLWSTLHLPSKQQKSTEMTGNNFRHWRTTTSVYRTLRI